MKRIILILTVVAGFSSAAMAQQRYSLKEAQDYAVKNSFAAQKADLDVKMAQSKIKETTAAGLPQINAEASYNDNVIVPTQLVPGAAFGGPPGSLIPVQFGIRHQASAGITATQLLFNGTYIVGLQVSKVYAEVANVQKEKTEVQIRQDVATAYFQVIAARENVATLEKFVKTTEQLQKEITAAYENGLQDEQKADQVKLNLNTLKNNIEYASQMSLQALNYLKFQMGLPQTSEIDISESLESLTSVSSSDLLNNTIDVAGTLDYKLAVSNVTMQGLNLKAKKAGYLPSLAMFATYQQNGAAARFNEFKSDYFFPASIIGFKLTIPIFSSGQKYQQVTQAKIDLDKARITEVQAREGIALEQQNARINFTTQLNNFEAQKENLAIAEKVKNKTFIMFQEGIASSFDLSQSESQYFTAQGAYIQAVINLLNSKVQFQKAYNKLN